MQFTDAVTVAGTRRTEDGYLIAEARSVRTGIQLYAGSEVGKPELSVVRVYRPADQVFADASLQSFTHAPVTMDHPAEAVTADNWKALAVGEVSTAAKKDGEWVHLPLILKDAAAIQAVETGKRELSAGYTCELVFGDGVTPDGEAFNATQTNIKINHLAIVDRARAGSKARIGDGAVWGASPFEDQSGLAPITKEKDAMSDALKTVVLGDKAVQVAVSDVAAIEAFKADAAKTLSDTKAAHDAAISAKDQEIGTLKADLKKAQDAALKPEDVDRMVADRAALVQTVKAIDSKIEIKGSDADLRRAAVKAKLGDEMVKDASDDMVTGMFKAIAKDVKPADPFARVVADGIQPALDAVGSENKAWNDGVSDLNAWRYKKEA
jgi:hypothetical protein